MTEDLTPAAPAALPPMGFYPDPEVPGQLRFWDGTKWHASQPTYTRPALGRGFSRLSAALWLLLAAQVSLSLPMVAAYVWGLSHEPYPGALVDAAPIAYVAIEALSAFAYLPVWIGTVAVWCVWQVKLARSADRDSLRRAPGWHAGSWFIPFANLVMPFQNMRDLWRAYRVRGGALLGWWWALFLISNFASTRVALYSFREDRTFAEINALSLMSEVLVLVATVVAILVVRRLSKAALDVESGNEGP